MRVKFLYGYLVIILILAFLVRAWPLEKVHSWDESIYLQHSEIIFSGKDNYNEFDIRPPLLPIIIAAGYFAKHHVFTAGLICALLSTAGVLFFFLILKKAYNERVAIIGSSMFAFVPYLVLNSHFILTDVPALTFFLIAIYLIQRGSNISYIISGTMLGAAILTRFTSIILAAILASYLIATGVNRKRIAYCLIFMGIVLAPYLIWAQHKFGSFLHPFIMANWAVSDQVGGIFYYASQISSVFPWTIFFGLILYVSMFIARRFQKIEYLFTGWLAAYLAYISIVPHKEARYLIPIYIPLIALSAIGFDTAYRYLSNWKTKKGQIFLAIILVFLIGIMAYPSFLRLNQPLFNSYETESYQVARYINNLNSTSKMIYTSVDYPVYAYYTYWNISRLDSGKFLAQFPSNMNSSGMVVVYKNYDKNPKEDWVSDKKEFTRLHENGNIVVFYYDAAKIDDR